MPSTKIKSLQLCLLIHIVICKLFVKLEIRIKMEPPGVQARVIKIMGRIGARGVLTEVRLQLLKLPHIQILRAVKGEQQYNINITVLLTAFDYDSRSGTCG